MRSITKRRLALLAATAGAAVALLGGAPAAATTGSPATTAGGSTFTNHATDWRLALRGDNPVALPAGVDATEKWSVVYVPEIPNREGFSSPFLLRSAVTGKCLRDEGAGRLPVAVTCQPGPTPQTRTLWDIHRVPDLVDNGRNFYFLFNRFTDNVLTVAPGSGRTVPVVTAPVAGTRAEADYQLWRQRPS